MSEQKTFKKGDEVYVKSLDEKGVVEREPIPGEPEDDQFYVITTKHYCRPSDVELFDEHIETESRNRDAEIQQKWDRVERAQKKILAGDTGQGAASEYFGAINDFRTAMGREPLFKKK